jgi:phosphatidylserine/phosphatidylglycerophosphate/cardiolipin synthase-like enzyme
MIRTLLLSGTLAATAAVAAPPLEFSLQGRAEVAFTPGDDIGALVVKAIGQARKQILVQAYSLTHRDIADALVAARKRGVDVKLIADHRQDAKVATTLVGELVARGVPVWLDAQHAAAHNKVMVIDAGAPDAAVVTGSFNFTHAAQYRNAENLLILRGNPLLAEAYAANWRRHRAHSIPVRK